VEEVKEDQEINTEAAPEEASKEELLDQRMTSIISIIQAEIDSLHISNMTDLEWQYKNMRDKYEEA
jgi:hypothetical protein